MENSETNQEEINNLVEPIPDSNYQSVRHFISLSLLSFGIYTFFWHYKHWLFLKEEKGLHLHPGFKSIFAVFTGYSLLRHFKKLAVEAGYKNKAPYGLFFFLQSCLLILNLQNTFSLILFFLAWLSPLLMLPALNMMNAYYLKTQINYKIRKKLGLDEWIFLAVVWVFLILTAFAN